MANNGKFAAIDQAIISLANFAASILLAALVSPTELGIYVIGFLAIYFIRGVQNGIIIQPLNTFGAVKEDDAFRPYFSAMAVHQLLLSVISAILAVLLGLFLTRLGDGRIGIAVFSLWFSFSTWQTQEFIRRGFYTRGEVHKAVWISLIANLVRLGLILIVAQIGQISGRTGLYAIGWGSLVATIAGLWLSRGYFTRAPQNILSTWRENWPFGRWILGASLADWAVIDLYPIIMAGMVSIAATGIYQALQNLVAPIHVLLRAIDTFATPVLAKTFKRGGVAKLSRDLGLIYLIAGVPVIGLLSLVLLFTPQLLSLMRGDTYLPYADGIIIMAIFYFFMFINRPLQMVFRAAGEGRQIFWANMLAALSIVTIGIWLINQWGLYGAMGGQALNAVIISLVLGFAWRKYSHVMKEKDQAAEKV